MEELDYWRLCDQLTIVQAALLLVGKDPGGEYQEIEQWEIEDHPRPKGYEAAKNAISIALLKGTLSGNIVRLYQYNNQGLRAAEIEGSINAEESRVDVEPLKLWLRARGFTKGFFFPLQSDVAEYLDPQHPRYAFKLAAAIKAWLAVDASDLKGKSPKQAAEKWLREHAAELQLTDEEGKQNEKGIDEISKVVNWQHTGGAPKTPRPKVDKPPLP